MEAKGGWEQIEKGVEERYETIVSSFQSEMAICQNLVDEMTRITKKV